MSGGHGSGGGNAPAVCHGTGFPPSPVRSTYAIRDRYRPREILRGGQLGLGIVTYETWAVFDAKRGINVLTCAGSEARDLVHRWADDMNERERAA